MRASRSTVFQNVVGLALMQYVRHCCLQRTKELLVTSTLDVAECAGAVGSADPFHFSRTCKIGGGAFSDAIPALQLYAGAAVMPDGR